MQGSGRHEENEDEENDNDVSPSLGLRLGSGNLHLLLFLVVLGRIFLRLALLRLVVQFILKESITTQPAVGLLIVAACTGSVGAVAKDRGVVGIEGISLHTGEKFFVHGKELVPFSKQFPGRRYHYTAAQRASVFGCFKNCKLDTGFPAVSLKGVGLGQEGVCLRTVESAPACPVHRVRGKPPAVFGEGRCVRLIVVQAGDDFLRQRDNLVCFFHLVQHIDLALGSHDPGIQPVQTGRRFPGKGREDDIEFVQSFLFPADEGEHHANLGLGAEGVILVAPVPVELRHLDGILEQFFHIPFIPAGLGENPQHIEAFVGRCLRVCLRLISFQQAQTYRNGLLTQRAVQGAAVLGGGAKVYFKRVCDG